MAKKRYEATPMGDKPYYVYELRYPEGFIDGDGTDLSDVIFYIGKGMVKSKGAQRIDEHESLARNEFIPEMPEPYTTVPKNDAIRKIWQKGMQVKKCIVCEFDDETEALAFESEHITSNVTPYLTNIAHAGPGSLMRHNLVHPPTHPMFILTPEMIDRMIND